MLFRSDKMLLVNSGENKKNEIIEMLGDSFIKINDLGDIVYKPLSKEGTEQTFDSELYIDNRYIALVFIDSMGYIFWVTVPKGSIEEVKEYTEQEEVPKENVVKEDKSTIDRLIDVIEIYAKKK